MAKELGDLIVRLSLDSAKFEDGIQRFQTQMSKIQGDFKNSATGVTDFDKATVKLRGSADTLTSRLKMQKDEVTRLEAAYQESVRTKGADAEETQKLAAKLDAARQRMEQTEKAFGMVNSQIERNQNGWYRLSVNLDGVGQKLQQVGASMSKAGMTLTKGVTTPIVGLGAACVKTFTGFDDSMRTVEATMGLVAGSSDEADANIQKLRDTAKEMGATTRYSASDAADALNYLALAGYDTDKACATLPTVLNLAAAGGMDLAKASDMVTDAMSALGIAADKEGVNVTRFSDELAKTAQKSNTSIEQLGEGILTVGGTAKNLAGGTVELNTALGVLADNGIKGAEGGTKLRNVILAMTPTTKDAKAAFKQLGINAYDANGKMKPLDETFGDINKGLKGMTDKQKTQWLNKVFNKQDLKAVSAMLAATATSTEELSFALSQGELELDIKPDKLNEFAKTLKKTGGEVEVMETLMADYNLTNEQAQSVIDNLMGVMDGSGTRWNELSGYIEDCEGATDQMSKTMEGGIGGAFRNLESAVEGVAIAFGERLAPHIQAIAEKITALAERFTRLSPETQDLIIKIGLIAAAVGPLLLIMGKAVSTVGTIMRNLSPLAAAIGKVGNTTTFMGKALAALTGPVGIVIAIVAALVAAFVYFYRTNEDFRNKVNEIWGAICAAFEPVVTLFQSSFQKLVESLAPLKESFAALWEKAKEIFDKLAILFVPLAAVIGAALTPIIVTVVGVANGIMAAIAPLVEAVIAAVDFVLNILNAVISLLTGDFAGAWESLKMAFMSLGDMFMNIFEAIIACFMGFWEGICALASGFGIDLNAVFAGIWSWISSTAIAAWDGITAWLSGAWEWIKTTASTAWTGITSTIGSAIDACKVWLENTWNTVTTWLSTTWTNISTKATELWNGITSAISGAVDTCKQGIETAWNTATTWLSEKWTAISTKATELWNGVTSAISGAVDTCKQGIETAWSTASTWLSTTWTNISGKASEVWNGITSAVSGAVDSCKKGVETAWNTAKTTVTNTWNGIKTTATTTWNNITSSVSSTVDTCKTAVTKAWDTASGTIKTTWNTLKTNATTTWGNICSAATGAVDSAKTTLNTTWTNISSATSRTWDALKGTATTSWTNITGAVSAAVSNGKSKITGAWDSVKDGVSSTWNKVTDIVKKPINTAYDWVRDKVSSFKGLFNFTWQLPKFKLPSVKINWEDTGIGGLKIPKFSVNWNRLGGIFRTPTIFSTGNAGLQGVGEAGPEAILPLDTLWDELSARLKSGMREILTDMRRAEAREDDRLVRTAMTILAAARNETPSVSVTQHIHADETSYVGQQREAARNFRQIARAWA